MEWLDRVKDEIKRRFGRLYVYRFFGHLIYREVKRARWRIPDGMKTLREFLRFAERKGLVQKRSDHPLALEVYIVFTTDRKLKDSEIRDIVSILKEMVLDAMFYPKIVEYMEFGYEEEPASEIEPLDIGIRISRDGIEFYEPWNMRDIRRHVASKLEDIVRVL